MGAGMKIDTESQGLAMRYLIGWLACLVVLLFVSVGSAQTSADEAATLQKQNAELRAELDRVKSAYDELEAETAKLQAELAKLRMVKEDLEVEKKELTELAGLTPTGDRVEAAASRFTSEYDEATGKTTVRTGTEKLHVAKGSAVDHQLSLAYSYDGQEMKQRPQTILMFIQARFSGGVYRSKDTATFDIDGEKIEVPIANYEAVARRTRVANKHTLRKDDETLTFEVDQDLFRKLARAIQVKISIGKVDLEPTRDQTALFRAIQKRIELGA